MRVNIELDTSDGNDLEALKRLVGAKDALPNGVAVAENKTGEAEPPAKKAAAPKPKPAPDPKPAPEPEPEPEESEEEVEETPEAPEAPEEKTWEEVSVDKATALATKMIGQGKADAVREALKAAGAKRVSALDEDNVATFLEALNG